MGWFSRKNGNDSNGTGKEGTPPRGILSQKEEIPRMVIDRLNNVNEGMAIVGVRALVTNPRYPVNDVCEQLVRLLLRDGREEIAKEATGALVEALKRLYNTDTVIMMIKRGLFANNETNAMLFTKILESEGQNKEIKACAIEMLAKYGETDVKPETMDAMEAALFERCMDPQELDEIKSLVKNRFGKNRNGRPKILSEEVRGEGSGRGDETIVFEGEEVAARDAASARASGEGDHNEVPTEAMDVLSGWIELLQHQSESRRSSAANILMNMALMSSDKATVAKIASALYGCGSEFWEQHRKVLSRLESMPLGDIRNTPTMPPMRPSNGGGNGNRNGGGPIKLRR